MADDTESPVGAALDTFTHPAVDVPIPSEGASSQASAPAPQTPAPLAHPAADVPTPHETVKASVSYKGVTPGTLAATGAVQSRGDQLADADLSKFAPENAAEIADANRVHQERITAIRAEGEANAKKAAAEHTYWQQTSEIQAKAAEAHQRAYADSQVIRQRYLGAYEHQLAAVRQLAMSSGDPMADLSRGQTLGLVGAQFAQGFLAARGINIDVSGQVDRWVNREIDKHRQKVQDARASAEDQMHLYEIARQTSADDQEAREKYTGMVLEGLKATYSGQAALFNSDIARAAAGQKIAEADALLGQTKSNLANRAQQLYLKTHEMRITQAHYQAADAAEMMRAQASLEAERNKTKAAAGSTMYFVDPTTGERIAKVTKGSVDADNRYGKLAEAQSGYDQLAKLGRRLVDLRDQATSEFSNSSSKWMGMGAFSKTSPTYREYEQTAKEMGMLIAHTFYGSKSSDAETERAMSMIPFESAYQKGDNTQQVINYLNDIKDRYAGTVRAYGEKLDEGEKGVEPNVKVDPWVSEMYSASKRGKEPGNQFVADEMRNVVQKDSDNTAGSASPLWQEYADTKPGSAMSAGAQFSERVGASSAADRTQSERMVAIDHLAIGAVAPEKIKGHADAYTGAAEMTPDQIRAESLAALENLASGKVPNTPEDAKRYAAWVLARVKADPAEVTSRLETRDEFMSHAMQGQ